MNILKAIFGFILLVLFIQTVNSQGCEKFVGSECAELEWQFVNPGAGEIAEIAISLSNPDIMHVGMENNAHALYKSTDSGRTWRRINGPGDHAKDVAVSPKNPDLAYVAMSESVHTTDLSINPTSRSMFDRPGNRFGDTQTVLSSGRFPGPSSVSFSTIEIFENDDDIIYAAVKGGSFGPSSGYSGPEIFKTMNRGVSWTSIRPNLDEVNAIEIHPTEHNIIYIGANDGVYVSKDSGNSIEKLKSFNDVISIEVQRDKPAIIYAASPSKVFKSEDNGKTWQDITGPLKDIHRVRISRSNPNVLYAATFNGIFKSIDSGKTWVDKTSSLKARNIQIVAIHPQNPDIAFVGTSSLWSSVRSEFRYRQGLLAHQGIFKTVDGGNMWFKSDDGIFEYNFEELAVNPAKKYEAWYAGVASRGALKTEDAGHNWRSAQIQTLHYPMRIKFSVQNPKKVYATSWHVSGPFAISDDGGISWTLVSENAFFDGVNRGRSLYKKSSQQNQIHLHGLAVDPTNDNILYAGSVHDKNSPGGFPLEGSHIFKSADGGKTWLESDEGFPHEARTAIHDIAIDPKDSSIIYAATTEHEAEIGKGIYKSADAGKTWKPINNGLDDLSINTIIIHPQNTDMLIAATHSGLYKSTNAGNNWQKTSNSHSFDVEYVADNPNLVYASTDDGVLKSGDFGDTWYKVNYGLPSGEGQGIGVDPSGDVIYAAVKNKGLYVARLADVNPVEPVSEFGSKGFGFGFRPETPDFAPNFPDFDEGFGMPKKPDFAEGMGVEDIPEFMLEEECKKHSWPPSCSFIPDKMGQKVCEACKKREKKELTEKQIEEELEEEIVKENVEKKDFFTKMFDFFKNMFGLKKEKKIVKAVEEIEPSKNDELADFIKETEEIMQKPKQQEEKQ